MLDTVLFAGFALAYLVLLAWGITLLARRGHLFASDVVLLVVAGLIYDNAIITAGRWVGEGTLLESLNLARFWIHALITPLLVLFAWHVLHRGGIGWTRTKMALTVTLAIVAGLVILEFVTVLADLQLEPGWEYGVLSYGAAAQEGTPLRVLIVAAALLVAGFLLWRRDGWVWLLVGAAIMTVGSAIPIPVASGAVTNAFELILITSLMATIAHQDARRRAIDDAW